ncbi:hypothetical protein WMY93_030029 [Mugilogobius chulae]|uniref:Uncharacterized protein n=1 Tax=Mugilogobius chulae TaxID=88201 RepID=A0AAW0MNG6_9GOBI
MDLSNKTESVTEECQPSTDLEVVKEPETDPQLILDQVLSVVTTEEEVIKQTEETEQTNEEFQSSEKETERTEEEIQPSVEETVHTEEEIEHKDEAIRLSEEQTEQTNEEFQSSEKETERTEEEIQPLVEESVHTEEKIQSSEVEIEQSKKEMRPSEGEMEQTEEENQASAKDTEQAEEEFQSSEEETERTKEETHPTEEEIQSSEEEIEHTEEDIRPPEEILSPEVIRTSFQQEVGPTLVFISLSEVLLQTDPEDKCETQVQTLNYASVSNSQILKETEMFSQSQDMTTPESDHECSPEQPEVFHQVETGSEEQSVHETGSEEQSVHETGSEEQSVHETGSEEQSVHETGSEEQSVHETQCEAQVTDLISLSEVFNNIQIGSEEQILCKTPDIPSSPTVEVVFEDSPEEAPAPDGPKVFKEADILPPMSDQECQVPSSETQVIRVSTEQEEHNSPPQILDGPPVSHFLIQALVRKLIQKSYFKSEDQAKIVSFLLEQTKDKILNQDIPISVRNMRAVAKTAAKDLMKEIKLQKMHPNADDEVFQEAMLKHLNTRLSNFLFGPKKRGLSRLFSAVRELFHST